MTSPSARPLEGRVCLVAGASRGVGRGIARGLGEAGATVIVTARSSEPAPTGGPRRSRTRHASWTRRAGSATITSATTPAKQRSPAWPVGRCAASGRVDGLFLSPWGGEEGSVDERLPDGSSFGAPFWRRPPARLGDLMRSSLYAGLLTMQALTPAMVAARRGLVLLAAFEDEGGYLGDPFHDLAQNALVRLAFVAGQELRPYGVTALALSPGFVRTERVVDAGRAAEATESLLYAGRAAAALMADPDVARHARSVVHAADLARAHGFTDEDGAQPARFRLTEG